MPDIAVVYEDDHLIVIDKPPGIVVNRAESVKGETVQEWAEQRLGITPPPVFDPDGFASRAGIVHRIDKETSGLLVIARNEQVFRDMQAKFKERTVKKTYVALVHGKLVPERGEIRAPVGRLPWNRERFGIVPGGREAITKYAVTKLFSVIIDGKAEAASMVELYPETGRTHQIRVHLKYVNRPILGDYLYAGRKVSRGDRLSIPRVMLHAWKIVFSHPVSGVELALTAPIPDDMRTVIGED